MKRSLFAFLFFLVIASALAGSSASAQVFKQITCDIPAQWTAFEEGNNVWLNYIPDEYTFILVHVQPTSGDSLQEIANYYYETFEGYDLEQKGGYNFTYNTDTGKQCNVYLNDSNTDSRITSGYFCMIVLTNEDASLSAIETVLNSITFHAGPNAAMQTFQRVILEVPEEWTAEQNNKGSIVTVKNKEDSSLKIIIQVEHKENHTLEGIAKSYFTQLDGYNFEQDETSGYYSFYYVLSEKEYLILFNDEKTDNRIRTGDYCVVSIASNSAADYAYQAIWNTIEFTEWNASPISDDKNYTIKTFQNFSVGVLNEWTASESNGLVTIRNNSDSEAYIQVCLGSKNGQTLQQTANDLCTQYGGYDLEQISGGYYSFKYLNSNNTVTIVFIDDDTTDSRVNAGCFWFVSVTSTPNTPSNEAFRTALRTITFTNSENNNVPDNSGIVIEMPDGEEVSIEAEPSQEDSSKMESLRQVIINPVDPVPIIVNTSNAGGGGCNTGAFSLLIFLAAFKFIRNK